jgi:hypothetical protein
VTFGPACAIATSSRTRVTATRGLDGPAAAAMSAGDTGSGWLLRISTSPPISDRAERATVRSRLSAKLPTPTSAATPSVMHAKK